MRHSQCRRSLLDGDLNPAVAEHLEDCDRCRAFARDLGQLSEYARAMDPGAPPDGLADRVLAHVRAAGVEPASAAAAEVLDLEREAARERAGRSLLRGPRRNPMLATLSVAAVMLLLVGVLAVLPGTRPGSDGPEIDPLLTAAEETLAAGTARLRLSGSAMMTVTVPEQVRAFPEVELFEEFSDGAVHEPPPFEPPPPPDFDDVPEEFRADFEEQYQQQVEEMRRQYEELLEQSRDRFEQLQADARAAFEELDIPDRFSFEAEISGEGAVVFPDRLRIDGSMEVVDAQPALPAQVSTDFAVVVTGATTHVKNPDGRWFTTPASSGPLAPLVADPDGIADLLHNADGDVEDLGEEELDGTGVRHFRFPVASAVFAPPGTRVSSTVDVWIGVDDGVVRKLTAASSSDHEGEGGFRTTMETEMTLELFDFGADVEVEAPEAAGRSSSAFGPAALLSPYQDEFASSLHFGLSS